MLCSLCKTTNTKPFYRDKTRDYFRCSVCHLTFVAKEHFLPIEEEKKRYDLHQNSPDDEHYRTFLNRLFRPLCERIAPGDSGLDFGSGPGPTLSVMFEEANYAMKTYDPFYANDREVLQRQYDFITATEVVEHLHAPQKEFDLLWRLLKPSGWLGLMTKLALDQERFSKWHYKNDPTHVSFFSKETFVWLANKWQATLTFIGNDVILFQKGSS